MKQSFAVLGLGRFGRQFAKTLIDGGADVLVVDRNEELVNRFENLAASAVIADLSDAHAVKELGLGNMDYVIVAMAESLESSIISTMIAKEAGAGKVLAKARNHRMGEILKKIGADEIVFPEEESAERTGKRLLSRNFLEYYDLGDNLILVNMAPKPDWVGKSLKSLNLRSKYEINVVAVRNKGKAEAHFSPDLPLEADSVLVIVVDKKNLKKLDQK